MVKIVCELVIRHPDGEPDITCPSFVCDWCEQKIINARMGLYKWREVDGKATDEPIVVLHKGRCDDLHTQATGMEYPWNELPDLLGFLINNSGLQWKDMIDNSCPDEQLKDVAHVVRQRSKPA
jgi:hypothetical protein